MPHASRTIVIDRPVGQVFAFFADAENDPTWRSGVQEITRQGEPGLGARYRQRVAGPAGRSIPADIEVTAFEPDVRLAFRGTAGPVRPIGEYRFTDLGGTTEVTFTLSAELTGVKKLLMGSQVQATMTSEVAALEKAKAVLERTAPR